MRFDPKIWEAHPGWSGETDSCRDCGATRTEWDDNAAMECPAFSGPLRRTKLVLQRALREQEEACSRAQATIDDLTNRLTLAQQELAARRAHITDLKTGLSAVEKP